MACGRCGEKMKGEVWNCVFSKTFCLWLLFSSSWFFSQGIHGNARLLDIWLVHSDSSTRADSLQFCLIHIPVWYIEQSLLPLNKQTNLNYSLLCFFFVKLNRVYEYIEKIRILFIYLLTPPEHSLTWGKETSACHRMKWQKFIAPVDRRTEWQTNFSSHIYCQIFHLNVLEYSEFYQLKLQWHNRNFLTNIVPGVVLACHIYIRDPTNLTFINELYLREDSLSHKVLRYVIM